MTCASGGRRVSALGSLLVAVCFSQPAFAQTVLRPEFVSYAAAQPVLTGMSNSLPPELKVDGLDANTWSAWVRNKDRDVRQRLNQGEEDTLTNLLRFGVTFTKEYRIDDEYLLKYGQSSLVDAFAEHRADDLVRALSSPNPGEGLARMRAFLMKEGFSFSTAAGRRRVRQHLLDNLAHMRDDFIRYRAQAKDENRFQMFQDRGISLDTNLWPDFLLDQHFLRMAEQGLLKPGSVRRVGVIGPGLDFANKEKGNDFYPPQTIQPFAVLDSLIRLGLADPKHVELYTLDISPDVNFHIQRARKRAQAGNYYVVQLPWNTSARQSPEYRDRFVQYWQNLGAQIGQPVAPIDVPAGAAEETQTRALRIRPEIVRTIFPMDANIVFQSIPLVPEARFDLLIGTNVFVYYNAFEQSLGRLNAAAMLRPGGFLLTNDKLPGTVSAGLHDSLTTTLVVARDPDMIDSMFSYARDK